jgi:hypothetical protein
MVGIIIKILVKNLDKELFLGLKFSKKLGFSLSEHCENFERNVLLSTVEPINHTRLFSF